MSRNAPQPPKPQVKKKSIDTMREIQIKSQVLAHEFASQLPPSEAPDPELDERMLLQFTRSRFSVGSTHLQGNLAQQLKKALNPLKGKNQATPTMEVQLGPAPEGLEAERGFRLLAPSLQEHIMAIINANPEDTALETQIRTLIDDDIFRSMSLGLQTAFVDTLIWNAEANLDFMLNFMQGKCFQTFLADSNYTEEQKSFELSFIADLSVMATKNSDSLLNEEKFRDLNGATLNTMVEELNANEGDRFLDAKFRQLLNSGDFFDMKPDYQQIVVSGLSQNPQARVQDITQLLRSAELMKISSDYNAVSSKIMSVIEKSAASAK